MLSCLRVHRFAIIEELEVGFERGLNVVTGETGAGKSILVSALQLVLGGRGRAEVVRTGADAAEVEALFDIRDDPAARARLEESGLSLDDEIILRRVQYRDGRTRGYVNGRLATATQLRTVAAGLVDISSQHEHQTLADPTTHLEHLDAFGRLEGPRSAVGRAWSALSEAHTVLRALEDQVRHRTEREDLLRYQHAEISALGLQVGEEERLEEESRLLASAERLAGTTLETEALLLDGEDAMVVRLVRAVLRLEEVATLDPRLAPLAQRLESVRLDLDDIAQELGRYSRDVVANPERLAEVEDRLHQIRRFKKKYGGTVEAVIQHLTDCTAELAVLDHSDECIEQATRERDAALSAATHIARDLSALRHDHAIRLGTAITAELSSLGMGEARVLVDVAPIEGVADGYTVDGARLTSSGVDRVEFLIAPNRGEEPRPLRKVASGGELSRSLLALKRVLAGIGPVGVYVFDEVDSGVGGAIAEVIGRKLLEVSRHHQVVCITHLPQIAAFADVHFHVSKGVVGDRTASTIVRLDATRRLEEMARMVGGIDITPATRQAASDMLQAAERLKG